MAFGICSSLSTCSLVLFTLLLLQALPVAAFGAGNIASISRIEGLNFRHGDIEDMLKTVAFLKAHKWTTMMVKRVYFGNWLRDYSQAVDVGSLKGVQAETIRLLVWVLSFLSFGYATAEFEVTEERLGVYRPEEHIDNPKDYADNVDARKYDPRLRPPVQPVELQIDPHTGMKNYIANENLGIATSSGYVKHSFTRSIHFGRVYTNGSHGTRGQDADLYEALRCLGQGLHCMEDFGAHSNYTELALREMGYSNVFSHTGTATEINLRGKMVFPIVTGTFGAVDFLMSVLGEAQDHFAQSEVTELDLALKEAQEQSHASDSRSFLSGPGGGASYMTRLLKQVPEAGSLVQQAEVLERASEAQGREVAFMANRDVASKYGDNSSLNASNSFQAPPGSEGGPPGPGIPGLNPNLDPKKIAKQIYPILEFRDKVVKLLAITIEKIPGLEVLVQKITETVTLFVLSLLAPFIRPVISAVAKQLKAGSTSVVDASGKHQYEPWTDPNCTDPTHSMLSKDHFSNILNPPAGNVATVILQYVAPRVIYAWEHPDVPIEEVMIDIIRAFHHPAIRDPQCELHRNMFSAVERWAHSQPNGGADLNNILSSDGVRHGKNTVGDDGESHSHNHGGLPTIGSLFSTGAAQGNENRAPWESGISRAAEGISNEARTLGVSFPGTETAYDNKSPEPSMRHPYGQPTSHYPAYGQSESEQQGYAYGYAVGQVPHGGYGPRYGQPSPGQYVQYQPEAAPYTIYGHSAGAPYQYGEDAAQGRQQGREGKGYGSGAWGEG